MSIVEQIKKLVREKSDEYLKNDPGKYDFWNGHLKYVYREAMNLAEKYGADIEVVQLGALLHDIALLEKVGTKADHHENGRILAEKILRDCGYPEDKMQRVLGCVLHHRSSKNAENLEELCVADADILAHFDNIPMLFDAAYNLHKMVGLENVRKFMRETFEKDFDDLSEKTKAEFEPRYKVICDVVLGEDKSDIIFRKLDSSEFDKLRELFGDDSCDLWEKYKSQRLGQFARREAETYVIEKDGMIIGEVTVTFVNGELEQETIPGTRVYLQAFRLLPKFRKQGLGQELMRYVLDELREKGYSEFTIGVEEDNVIAHHVYEKFGFTEKIAHGKGDKFDPSEYDLYLLKY